MKMIVGLGNPGAEYAGTRHNVGWMLVDALAEKLGINEWRSREKGMVAEGRIGSEKVLLVKPLTYMNNSGECAGPLMRWYKLEPEDIMVAHDDMDIPVGTIRIRKKGSAGGHNGIKSLLQHIGSENFGRLRIGIGRPQPGWSVINHVLAKFTEEERAGIDEAIHYLLPAVECMVLEGADMAMNKFNPKKAKKPKQSASKQKQNQVPVVENHGSSSENAVNKAMGGDEA